MGIFILATLQHWYSRHQSRIYVPFSFYCLFRSVFTEFSVFAQVRLLIQQLLAFAHRVIFNTSSVRGRLLAQNKVQYIAKACRVQHIQESRRTSRSNVGSKRHKLVARGLVTIDHLPTISLALEQLQTWDMDCCVERLLS